MKQHLLLVLFSVGIFCSYGQNPDSLKSALSQADGLDKIDILLRLADFYGYRDWEQAVDYAEQSLIHTQKTGNDSLLFESYYYLSRNYEGIGNYSEAVLFGNRALEIAYDAKSKSSILHHLGLTYESMSEYQNALDHFLRALEIRRSLGSKDHIANTLNSLSFVYKGMNQYEKAIETLKEAQVLYEETGNRHLAGVIFNTGLMMMEMGDYTEAIPYFRKAMVGKTEEESPGHFSSFYNNLANCFRHLLDENPAYYDSSLYYGKKNLRLKERLNDYRGIANAHNTLASTYERASDYENEYYHSIQAYRITDSLDIKAIKRNALLYLITAEIKLQDRTANDHFEEFIRLEEELSKDAHSRTLSEMATRYETEKKEAENELLKAQTAQQKQINLLLICLAIALVVALVFLFFFYKSKQRINKRLAEDKRIIEDQSEKLEELNRLKSQFFASISHELRTPLTLIQGNSDTALQAKKLPVSVDENLKSIRRNTRQLNAMVNDLLDLSKLELNKYTANNRPVAIDRLLERIIAAFISLAENKKINLQFINELPDETIAFIDPTQFEKVMNNLIYNAFKFTEYGGSVKVTLDDDAEMLKVSVEDNGRGMIESELPYIFDRFYQVANADQSVEGTGLGLAISKELIQLMGGEISVESTEGKGSVFHLFIQKTSEPAEDYAAYLEKKEEVYEPLVEEEMRFEIPNDATVMIVEDNLALREYLSVILSSHFKLVKAVDGLEAMEKLKRTVPDLILTDVMMPGMDGWQLIAELKRDPRLATIPVIILSAIAESEERRKGLRLGIDDFIIKPFEAEELMIRITNTIQNLRNRVKWAKEMGEEDEVPDSKYEHDLILQIKEYVQENVSSNLLSVPAIAHHLGVSERQLYRKVTGAIGMSPAKLVIEIKLIHARDLLVSGRINKLSQIAQEIGFESAAHFAKLYFDRFGKKPTDYFS